SGAAIAETDVLTTANPHEATESVNSLTRDGYFVRIARRPASQPQLPYDRAPIALVVENEPVLARFVTH
ncbi:MAG: hypothetical protein ACXWUU_03620, partial [Burkholderiales bacterium]